MGDFHAGDETDSWGIFALPEDNLDQAAAAAAAVADIEAGDAEETGGADAVAALNEAVQRKRAAAAAAKAEAAAAAADALGDLRSTSIHVGPGRKAEAEARAKAAAAAAAADDEFDMENLESIEAIMAAGEAEADAILNGGNKGDKDGNDQEDDEDEDEDGASKKTKKKKPKRKNPILDIDRLLDRELGIPRILREMPKLKFRGKGYERHDLAKLMGFYRAWGDRLHGMATFHDFVLRLEKLGSSTKLKEYMKNLRLGVEVRRNVQADKEDGKVTMGVGAEESARADAMGEEDAGAEEEDDDWDAELAQQRKGRKRAIADSDDEDGQEDSDASPRKGKSPGRPAAGASPQKRARNSAAMMPTSDDERDWMEYPTNSPGRDPARDIDSDEDDMDLDLMRMEAEREREQRLVRQQEQRKRFQELIAEKKAEQQAAASAAAATTMSRDSPSPVSE